MDHHSSWWRLLPIVVLALAGASCGSSSNSQSEEFVTEFLAGALPNASDFQAEILNDGVVDFSEYERSVLATVSCLSEAGLEVLALELDPDGHTLNYLYRGVDAEGNLLPDSTVNARFNRCYSEFEELVSSVWSAEHAVSFGDAPPEEKEAYVKCLDEQGVTIAPDSHITDIAATW
jgi:hypothetical protein